MDWQRITDFVILFSVVALILFNVAAGVMGGGDATISARMQHHAARFPVVPYAVGLLCGHWFWPVFGPRNR